METLMNPLYFKKLSEYAICPTRAEDGAAGYDLYAAENAIIYSLTRQLIKTDIAVQIPDRFYGRVAPRSGLALKQGIDVMAGVIDPSYRNGIGVILFNSSNPYKSFDNIVKTNSEELENLSFHIKKGDRIAQLIIEAYYTPEFIEVKELSQTSRGEGGFGSTGK